MKRISVCIATYNGERFVYEQVKSILVQLSENDEIIISDDGSTDKTLEIVRNIRDKRINILEERSYKNPIKNFENALKNARGEFIFLSDQDDIWGNNKVASMLRYLEKYEIVVSDCCIIDEKGKVIHESFFKIRKSGKGLLKNLIKNTYIGCCMAFDRKVLEASLPFPKRIPMHDWWIGLVGELIGKCIFLQEPLTLYRRHGSNESPTSEKSSASIVTKFMWRYHLVTSLIQRKAQIHRISQC